MSPTFLKKLAIHCKQLPVKHRKNSTEPDCVHTGQLLRSGSEGPATNHESGMGKHTIPVDAETILEPRVQGMGR